MEAGECQLGCSSHRLLSSCRLSTWARREAFRPSLLRSSRGLPRLPHRPPGTGHPPAQATISSDLGKRKGQQTRPGLPAPALRKPQTTCPRGLQRTRVSPHSPAATDSALGRGRDPGPASSMAVSQCPWSTGCTRYSLTGAWRLSKENGQGVPVPMAGCATGQQCLGFVSGPQEGTVSGGGLQSGDKVEPGGRGHAKAPG